MGGSLYLLADERLQKGYSLFEAQILDELREVYGAPAFGVTAKAVKPAIGGVAERG